MTKYSLSLYIYIGRDHKLHAFVYQARFPAGELDHGEPRTTLSERRSLHWSSETKWLWITGGTWLTTERILAQQEFGATQPPGTGCVCVCLYDQ